MRSSAPQSFADDGRVFYVGTYFGDALEILSRAYIWCLHVVPRLVAYGERLVPTAWAPLVGNLAAIALVTAIATHIASSRLAPLLPDWRSRLFAAAGFFLLPATHETLGSIALVQAYLVVFIMAVSLAAPSLRASHRAIEATAVTAAALSSPLGVVLVPFHLLRSARYGPPVAATTVLLASVAVVQSALVLTSRAAGGPGIDAGTLAPILAPRSLVEPVFGGIWTGLAVQAGTDSTAWLAAGVVLGGLLAVAALATPRPLAVELGAFGVILGTLGAARSLAFVDELEDQLLLQRHFVPVSLVVVTIVSAGLFGATLPARCSSVAVASMLVLAMVADFRVPSRPDLDWAGQYLHRLRGALPGACLPDRQLHDPLAWCCRAVRAGRLDAVSSAWCATPAV